MDEFAEKLAGIGIPALVFLGVMSGTGLAGAAAVTATLAALGPGGMIGGIATLLIMGGGISIITKYGYSAVMIATSKKIMVKQNLSKEEMNKKIDKMPITKTLKARIKSEIDKVEETK